MYREKNKATCRRFVQKIFNEGDLSTICDFVSPDSLHYDINDFAELSPSGHSPEWFSDMLRLYRIAFPDLSVDILDQIAEGDRVVTCLQIQGTQKGPLMGIGVSGKTVDITGIRIDRLAEGKIAESWFHWDGLGMLQQIGALPDLARTPQAAPWAKETASLPNLMKFPTPPPQIQMPRPSAVRLKPAA
jgi:predicted ester cyclase